MRRRRVRVAVMLAAGVGMLVLALPVLGASSGLGAPAAPLTGLKTLVSGLPSCAVTPGFPNERSGPAGVMDDGKYLFIGDECNKTVYRVPSTGGSLAHAKRAKLGHVLAFAKIGTHYFLTTFGTDASAGVWEFNPTTLALTSKTPTVAVPDIRGLAIDPKTHDVFVSSDQKIVRIHNLAGKKPVVTTFGGPAAGLYDSLAFSPSGGLLYSADRYNYPNVHIVALNRAGSKVVDVVDPYQGEGIEVARSGLLFVNNNGTNGGSPASYGSVSTLAPKATTLTTVATGGTRGGFSTVDCKGYMLVDQSSSIVRLEPALFPPNAAAGRCSSLVKH